MEPINNRMLFIAATTLPTIDAGHSTQIDEHYLQ
jgi:hypothetical protein